MPLKKLSIFFIFDNPFFPHKFGTSNSVLLVKRDNYRQHSGAVGGLAASQRQGPGIQPDLGCYLCDGLHCSVNDSLGFRWHAGW